jgi:hypothetical protein
MRLPDAKHWGLDPDKLPRGVIIGTVELYDCDGGERPNRLFGAGIAQSRNDPDDSLADTM